MHVARNAVLCVPSVLVRNGSTFLDLQEDQNMVTLYGGTSFILFYFLFYFILFYFILFYYLFYFILFYFIQLFPIREFLQIYRGQSCWGKVFLQFKYFGYVDLNYIDVIAVKRAIIPLHTITIAL